MISFSKIAFLSFGLATILAGCSATELKPQASRVLVTHQPAPKGCQYLGTAIGEQGGSFTGRWTSNKNLAKGAFNDMKNQAVEMGGNYVVLENQNAGNTTSGSWYHGNGGMSGGQTDVTYTGNVFRCPQRVAGAK